MQYLQERLLCRGIFSGRHQYLIHIRTQNAGGQLRRCTCGGWLPEVLAGRQQPGGGNHAAELLLEAFGQTV
jgi:hypothetical protein